MTDSAVQSLPEIRRSTVDRLIGLAGIIGVPLGALLFYRVAMLGLNPWFSAVAMGLFATPLLYLYRDNLSVNLKTGLLMGLALTALVLNMYNQGLLSQAPLIIIVASLLLIDLIEPKFFKAIMFSAICLVVIGSVPHFFAAFDPSTLMTNNTEIVNRTLTVSLLMVMALAAHSGLMEKLVELSRTLDQQNQTLVGRNNELDAALSRIQQLEGFLRVCAWCKKIESEKDSDNWVTMERFLEMQTPVSISHGMCPECYDKQLSEEEA